MPADQSSCGPKAFVWLLLPQRPVKWKPLVESTTRSPTAEIPPVKHRHTRTAQRGGGLTLGMIPHSTQKRTVEKNVHHAEAGVRQGQLGHSARVARPAGSLRTNSGPADLQDPPHRPARSMTSARSRRAGPGAGPAASPTSPEAGCGGGDGAPRRVGGRAGWKAGVTRDWLQGKGQA